jgi:uncharacterized protein (DUF1800 family)
MALERSFMFRLYLALLAGLAGIFLAQTTQAQESTSNREEIIHVLNRITFGPRPGDVEAVEKMGLQNYIQQQLHPESIDDSAVEQELSNFELLQMSQQQLTDVYNDDLKKVLKKAKKAAELKLAANTPAPAIQPASMQTTVAPQGQEQVDPQPPVQPAPDAPVLTKAQKMAEASSYRSVAAIGQLEQAKLVRAIDSQRQLQEVLADFWNNHFNVDVKKKFDRVYKITDDRDTIRPHIWGKFRDLLEADAKSPAMLIYLDNFQSTLAHTVTPGEVMVTEMIDNRMKENGNGAIAPPVPKVGDKKGGVNENYGREIMELHTLGVDGGYTQQDVQEVARCFTGWGIDRKTGDFAFHPRLHDNGAKVVLGHDIPAGGGIQDGETVLDILASSPATAHHIAFQLCQRFVADSPPPALVDRIAGVFTQTGGDLRQVTGAILSSPEFLSPSNYGNKIKSPFEFTVSAVRATESTIIAQQPAPFDKLVPAIEGGAILGRGAAADRMSQRPRQSLNWHIYELGEPLFACTPPTGYSEVSTSWVSPGALIERLNFALALTGQKLSDVRFDPSRILAGIDVDKPDAVLNQCVHVLLQDNISDTTRQVLEKSALPPPGDSQTVNPSKLIALIIGSPEFQRK